MKKLLMLTYDVPYPPESGGKTRAYNLLKFLSSEFEIHLLTFYRNSEQLTNLEPLKKITKEIISVKRGKAWSLSNVLKTGFGLEPFSVVIYQSKEMVDTILDLKSLHQFDFVLLESFYASGYLKYFLESETILGTENIESQIYERLAATVNPLIRPLLQIDIAKMKLFEKKTYQRAKHILAVSSEDKRTIKIESGQEALLIPNGVDVEFFRQLKNKPFQPPVALFVGNWNYIQNRDAARFLLTEIWPMIKKEFPNVQLWLVGRQPGESLTKLAQSDVFFKTDVDDIRQVYALASVFLCPIRAASGSRLKIIESFAARVPVVSTSVGIEGLGARERVNYLRAENAQSFVEGVKIILGQPNLAKELTEHSFELVRQNLDWPKIVETLRSYLSSVYEAKS